MKIVYSFYFLLITSTLSLLTLVASGSQKPKTVLTPDESAPGGLNFPNISNWTGFQINYSGQPITIGFIPEKKYDAAALLIGFPAIGHYRGDEYNFKKRLALIQFNPKNAVHNIPGTLQAALAQLLAVNTKELHEKLIQLDVRFNAIIVGTAIDPKNDSPENSYNLAYHFWGGLWHKTAQNIVQFYVENFELGIFDPQGVAPKDLKLDALIPFNVSWHAPEHMSPDNARIIIQKERSFASFWAAAVSPDKKHVSITLFLVSHTPAAENFIARALHQAPNIFELKVEIDTMLNKKHEFTQADSQVVKDWINTVFKIVDPEIFSMMFAPVAPPTPKPAPAVITAEQLLALSRELNSLANAF